VNAHVHVHVSRARSSKASVGVSLAVALASCHKRDEAPAPTEAADLGRLASYLRGVAALDDTARRREIARWQLDEATFRTTLQPVYAPLYADYAARFADAVAPLAAALGSGGVIVAKRHYADDAALTPSQFRIRWMLPVEYPTAIATRDGAPIDAVFAPTPGGWGVLANVDAIARDRVRALAPAPATGPACDRYLDRAVRLGRCGDVGWAIVDAAARGDAGRLAHACELAATACAP
jgi:hypothetical protein